VLKIYYFISRNPYITYWPANDPTSTVDYAAPNNPKPHIVTPIYPNLFPNNSPAFSNVGSLGYPWNYAKVVIIIILSISVNMKL
jgi:hypothetical protein